MALIDSIVESYPYFFLPPLPPQNGAWYPFPSDQSFKLIQLTQKIHQVSVLQRVYSTIQWITQLSFVSLIPLKLSHGWGFTCWIVPFFKLISDFRMPISSRNSHPTVHYPLNSNTLLQYIKQINLNFSEESVTFNTLRGLRDRGVKVELGFPDEMWETPDAEVTRLKSRVYAFSVIFILWL